MKYKIAHHFEEFSSFDCMSKEDKSFVFDNLKIIEADTIDTAVEEFAEWWDSDCVLVEYGDDGLPIIVIDDDGQHRYYIFAEQTIKYHYREL